MKLCIRYSQRGTIRLRTGVTLAALFTFFFVAFQANAQESYSLEQILEIAVKKNPTFAAFSANLEAARGALRTSKAFPNPELELQYGKGRALEEPGSSYQREYGFGVAQLFEWPGKRSNRRKAAETETVVAQQELEDFRLELKAQVKESFFSLLLSEKILDASRKNVDIAKALLDSARLRVESGESPELELIKAQVEHLKVTKDLRRAESRLIISRAALNNLLDGSLPDGYAISGDFNQAIQQYELASLINSALVKHPAVLRQENAFKSAGYVLSEQKQSIVPDVALFGGLEEEVDKRGYFAGLSFQIPLLYQRQGEVAEARAAQARAEAELRQTKAELGKRITEEYQNYQIAAGQIEIFQKGLLTQAEEALRIAQLSYQQGESDLLELLDAQRTYRSTLIEYYEAQFELEAALARLERVTGGLQ